jgi:glycosyltransferase involved in cell wall biosynthesis
MKAVCDLTILLPVFNEKDNLASLVDEIKAALGPLGKTYEVLFVDDGSTDGSLTLLHKLESDEPQVRVIEFDSNFGQSAALGAGFRGARGEVVVTLDSDGQNDPADIPKLLKLLENKSVDAVCGVRTKRIDSWQKRFASRFANWVRNKVSGDSIQDTGCSLKAFRKECLDDFFYFYGMHRFFPTLLRMSGYQVIETPVNHRPRTRGLSKYSTRNRLIHPFLDLLAVRWMKDKQLRYRIREREDSHV